MKYKKKFDSMLKLFADFNWKIKTGKKQIFGSPTDIYAEYNSKKHGKYWMRIDDGNCDKELNDAVYHIHVGAAKRGSLSGKIFEGRIETRKEFKVVMKVLGFTKKKINKNV